MATTLDARTESVLEVEGAPPPARSRLRKTILAVVGATVFLGAIAFGVHYWLWSQAHEETDDAYITGHVHQIGERIAGTVEDVLVDDNQHVERNQLLVRLDPHDFQVRLAQAQAALQVARQKAASVGAAVNFSIQSAAAQQTEAKGGIRAAQAAIATAQAAVAGASAGISRTEAALTEADAKARRAKLDYQRYSDLVAKDQVSRQQFDHARAGYDAAVAAKDAAEQAVRQAKARLAQAQESVDKARAQLVQSHGRLQAAQAAGAETSVRRSQYEAATAAIVQAESAVESAKLQLSYTEIRSPVTGRIGKKGIEAGQRVQPGQPLLAIVEDDFWVVANYKETQLTGMKPGQPVEITVDSFPDHTFRGRVDSISPGTGAEFSLLPPDNATGNFTKVVQRIPVKIHFDRESIHGYEDRLVPGMSVVAVVAVR
jgi:membrane fusion protein (multidrug efflux system)